MAHLKDLIVSGVTRFLGKVYGNLEGLASNAKKDDKDQNIANTYIKDISGGVDSLTITKGDGNTENVSLSSINADTVDDVHISCINDATTANWFAAFTNENNLRAIDPQRAYVGNAGNAHTVDGYHIRCEDVATPNYNWFATFDNDGLSGINPGRAYVGNAGLLKPTLIGTAEHCTYHTILDWANSVNGMGQAVIVEGSGYPSDIPVGDEGMITVETDNENMRKVVTFKSYGSGRGTYRRNIRNGEWRWDWQDIADADTLDGLHANGFIKVNGHYNYDCNTLYDAGLYLCGGASTNTPSDLTYGTLFVMPYRKPYGNYGPDYCTQIFIPNGDVSDKSLWYRTSLQNTWNEWKRSCDGGNADYAGNSGAINGRLWREINSGLLSDIAESGLYDVHQTIDDAPIPQHGLLIAEYNVGTPMQIFFPDSIGSFYKRNKYGDTWGDWSEFFESKSSIKSMRFPSVTTNADGWQSLGITVADYNIIGYQCNTNDHRVELYKGSDSNTWYAYGIQQYPNPGTVAADTVLDITIFYI